MDSIITTWDINGQQYVAYGDYKRYYDEFTKMSQKYEDLCEKLRKHMSIDPTDCKDENQLENAFRIAVNVIPNENLKAKVKELEDKLKSKSITVGGNNPMCSPESAILITSRIIENITEEYINADDVVKQVMEHLATYCKYIVDVDC